jgi:hypothetical protein
MMSSTCIGPDYHPQVALPNNADPNAWIASNMSQLFVEVADLSESLTDDCNERCGKLVVNDGLDIVQCLTWVERELDAHDFPPRVPPEPMLDAERVEYRRQVMTTLRTTLSWPSTLADIVADYAVQSTEDYERDRVLLTRMGNVLLEVLQHFTRKHVETMKKSPTIRKVGQKRQSNRFQHCLHIVHYLVALVDTFRLQEQENRELLLSLVHPGYLKGKEGRANLFSYRKSDFPVWFGKPIWAGIEFHLR